MDKLIGDRIKYLRNERGITQEDIASYGLTRTVLSKIETNKMLPSIPQLEYLCEKLGISVNYFFNKENIDPIYSNKNIDSQQPNLLDMYNNKKYLDIIELYEKPRKEFFKNHEDLFYIAMCYFNLDIISKSLELFEKFIHYYEKFNSNTKNRYVENYAESVNILSWAYNKKSKCYKALCYLYLARDELIKYDKINTRISSIIHSNIGSICCLHKKYQDAIDILENFISQSNNYGYIYSMAAIHLSLNIAYYAKENYEKALYHIKKAILLFDYTEKHSDSHECYINYINSLRFLNKFSEALNLLSDLKVRYEDDIKLNNMYLILEMVTYFNLENYDKATVIAKDIKIKNLRVGSQMDYYFIMGHIEFLNNRYDRSLKFFKKCESFFKRKNFLKDLNLMYRDISLIEKYQDYSQKYVDTDKTPYKKNICL